MFKSGHIFKLYEKEVIVMTNDLEFYKVKRSPGMVILGQEVSFSKSDIIKPKRKMTGVFKYGALVSSVAAVLIVLALSFFQLNPTNSGKVYAYIDIDTNLSLRLSIDDENKVLRVKPIDDSARVIVDSLDLENKNIDEALSDIIKKSKEKGFTPNANEYMVISGSLNSKNIDKSEEQKLNKLLNKVNENINNNKDVEICTKSRFMQVDPEIRKLASQINVSMAKYVQYIKSKEKGVDITLDEVRKAPLTDIMKKADVDSSVAASNKVASNEKIPDTKTNTALNSGNSTPSINHDNKNNHDSYKPDVVISHTKPKQLYRTIPSPIIPSVSSPKSYATPYTEVMPQTNKMPAIPTSTFKHRPIPAVIMTPDYTPSPYRTFIPQISPTPVSTPVVPDNTAPSYRNVSATPEPLPTPVSTPGIVGHNSPFNRSLSVTPAPIPTPDLAKILPSNISIKPIDSPKNLHPNKYHKKKIDF